MEHISPLGVAVRLLPQAIVGLLVNAIAGLIMHRVSNRLLMAVGALAYAVCFALFTAFDPDTANAYWKYCFPALCLSVVGADFEFTVTNVCSTPFLSFSISFILTLDLSPNILQANTHSQKDVRNVDPSLNATIHRRRTFQHSLSTKYKYRARDFNSRLLEFE